MKDICLYKSIAALIEALAVLQKNIGAMSLDQL